MDKERILGTFGWVCLEICLDLIVCCFARAVGDGTLCKKEYCCLTELEISVKCKTVEQGCMCDPSWEFRLPVKGDNGETG